MTGPRASLLLPFLFGCVAEPGESPSGERAWSELVQAMPEARLERDPRGTPARLELAFAHTGDAASARAELDRRAGHLVAAVFERADHDELVATSGDLAARRFRGLPVFDDRYRTTVHEETPGTWRGTVHARWTPGLDAIATAPAITASRATEIAIARGDLPGGTYRDPTLGICTHDGQPRLCWQVELRAERGSWGYRIDAQTGEVLRAADRVRHATGTVKIPVPMVGGGTTYESRPLPHAWVYEDAATSSVMPACGGSAQSRTQGDDMTVLGTTTAQGTYSLVGDDPADTAWVVDFRGPYVLDESRFASLALPDFAPGSSPVYATDATYARTRRGEVFYHLNYARDLYAWAGIAQHDTVMFNYYALGPCGDSPPDACNTGHNVDNCMTYDVSEHGSAAGERAIRNLIFHEHNHSLYTKVNGDHCSAGECWPAEEGRVDFGALLASRFEVGQFELEQPLYLPDLKYPDDVTGGLYRKAAVWTSLYAHYLLRVGVLPAIVGVFKNLAFIDEATTMVGTCTDNNADGHVVVGECPANSFYRWLLDADADHYSAANEHSYEISEIFHAHVTDADPVAAGIQTFPWLDELPNTFDAPMFIGVELGAPRTISSGGPTGSGSLRFHSVYDHDTVMFLGRAGESYTVETLGLESGMDTILEVYNRAGATLLGSNDDCPGIFATKRSCVTFTPTATALYIARVRTKLLASIGPSNTYQIKVSMLSDDYGDAQPDAHALPANGVARSGKLHDNDTDTFRVISSTSQTMTLALCSTTAGATVTAQVLDKTGAVIATHSNAGCPAISDSVSLATGAYVIRVSSPQTSATYTLAVSLPNDIDGNGTPASGWSLQTSGGSPRVVGAHLTAGDEDWFKIAKATQGQRYTIETYGSNVTPTVEIYAPATTLFGRPQAEPDALPDTSGHGLGYAMVKDANGALESGEGRVTFIAPASGTYHVRVYSAAGAAGSYHLMFDDEGPNTGWLGVPFP